MTDFATFVRSHGILPKGPIVPDGQVHRCPTESKPRSDNGAWWLALDGSHGWVQDWATMADPVYWHQGEDAAPDAFDPAKLRRAAEEHERKRRRKRASAVRATREFWNKCKALRWGHPYLKDHGLDLTGCEGLRIDPGGRTYAQLLGFRRPDGEDWLIVPGVRRGHIMTVQRIAPDGTKRFWKDAPAKAVSHMIDRDGAVVTVVCEGLATGLALFAAVPLSRVLVTFNTGNMAEPDVLRRIPTGPVVVAADNDRLTVCPMHREKGLSVALDPRDGLPDGCRCNPGIRAALVASQALGCGIAVPEPLEGSDWCDTRMGWMAEAKLVNADSYKTTASLQRDVDSRIRLAVMRGANLLVR